jgi:hypothetical protein
VTADVEASQEYDERQELLSCQATSQGRLIRRGNCRRDRSERKSVVPPRYYPTGVHVQPSIPETSTRYELLGNLCA